MKLWLATSNAGKVGDFGPLAAALKLEPLPDFSSLPAVEETGASFEENARIKAEHYSRLAPGWVLADDSGLEVGALGGEPGVRSARFAGRHGDDGANNALLLERLRGVAAANRTARFVCVLALSEGGHTLATFRGEASGRILELPCGTLGFGYDPLFYSLSAGRSFGELERAEKAGFSHRGAAARALADWLHSQVPPG